MAAILEWIEAGRTVALDGGMGSQLIARGLKGGEHWNLERPEVVRAIHQDYRAAGAAVLLTNTFGANRLNLARQGQQDRVADFNRAGVALARQAAGDAALVAGDIGPVGEFMEPYGDRQPEELLDAFTEQASALASAGVDFFLIETLTVLEEAGLAIRACRQVSRLPVAAAMSFDPAGGGYRTLMGKTPEQCARALEDAGADIVGTNCGTVSPAQMAEIAARMRAATALPLLCEANAGAPRMEGGAVRYEQTPGEWLAGALACRDAGAQLVGGCCGTTPAHIRLLAEAVAR
ncbi:MAG: homocysteine S-methyltransferase family protein [Armatimonadetes bacterium]|nr:homocysteine S-methyltransferase family protein [Armatimonadota bacterium]